MTHDIKDRTKKIFVASTFRDLLPFRQSAALAIAAAGMEADVLEPLMELSDQQIVEICKSRVNDADACIFIVSSSRGSTPRVAGLENSSFTSIEYDAAMTARIPIFVFHTTEPQNELAADPWVLEWRRKQYETHMLGQVDSPDKLRSDIVSALSIWQERERTAKYTIHPLEPAPIDPSEEPNRTEEWIKVLSSNLWIAFVGAIAVGVVLSSLWPELNQRALVVLLAFGPLVWLILVTIRELNQRYNQRINAIKARKIQEAQEEASSTRSLAMAVMERARGSASALKSHLGSASQALRQAKHEYGQNAYAPFWDAVERAARDFDCYRRALTELKVNADKYYDLLAMRIHTFPSLGVDHQDSLPDPTPVVNDLKAVLSMGKTNFQFAIWKQRQTRHVLVAGFETRGDALRNLEGAIISSVQSLEMTLSSRIAQLVDTVDHSHIREQETSVGPTKRLQRTAGAAR